MSYERTNRSAQQRSRTVRWTILGVVLVVITAIATAHQFVAGAGKPVGIDALCPFGGIESLFSLISGAGFIEKTAASSLALLVGTIVLALVFRRSFCGQLCPLGALQGLFGSIGGRLFRRRPVVPKAVDRVARWLKYAVLVFFAIWTWQAASLVMRPYDPWVAWAHLTSTELFAEYAIGVAVLGIALVGSLIYERFFCKYLCPMGAFLGAFSKFSAVNVERDADACINCSACDKACPMNIEVSTAKTVTSSECISCNECVNACPAAGALEVKAPGRRRISPLMATGIVVVITLVIIGGTSIAGTFEWTMPSLGEAIEQSHTQETSAGQETPDTSVIKGYMSMREISKEYGIPEEAFVERWGVPESDLARPMKDIKDQYDFSPDDVKTWVGEELAK